MNHKLLKIWIALCFCYMMLSVLIVACNIHSVLLSVILLVIVCVSWVTTWEIDTDWSKLTGNLLVRTKVITIRTLLFVAQSILSTIATLCWYGN